MKVITKRELNFCTWCTYCYEVGKLGRCRCGNYIDHGVGNDPKYMPENRQWFMYMRRMGKGPFGDSHYRDEAIRIVEIYNDDMRTQTLLIDKKLNPTRLNPAHDYKEDFYVLTIDESEGEKLAYDN